MWATTAWHSTAQQHWHGAMLSPGHASTYNVSSMPCLAMLYCVMLCCAMLWLQVYWGGGSANYTVSSLDWSLLADGPERFEDGTLPFLDIISMKHGEGWCRQRSSRGTCRLPVLYSQLTHPGLPCRLAFTSPCPPGVQACKCSRRWVGQQPLSSTPALWGDTCTSRWVPLLACRLHRPAVVRLRSRSCG